MCAAVAADAGCGGARDQPGWDRAGSEAHGVRTIAGGWLVHAAPGTALVRHTPATHFPGRPRRTLLGKPITPGNSMAEAERWAAGISGPAYAMDDETAIKVVDDTVEVGSEGHWKYFPS